MALQSEITFPGPVPKEALEFFRAKGWAVGFDHRDVWREEHAVAFTVAKAMSIDLLETIHAELDNALADGLTYRAFAKELKPRLIELGWWGRKSMVDPITGEEREVQLGSPRRLKTIYRINMRMARAAGQWARIQRTKTLLGFLMYALGPSLHHRDEHASWAQTILPVDDPWWDEHFTPNGWGCKCHIIQLGRRRVDELGGVTARPATRYREWKNKRTGEVSRVPRGIDPGFDYNVGKARMRAFMPPPRGGLPTSFPPGVPLPPLPPPRTAPSERLLPPGLAENEYVRRFLAEFGAAPGKPRVHVDQAGQPVVIGEELFRDPHGKLKVVKGKRAPRLLLVADALRHPDEIWWIWEPMRADPGRHTLRRRYIARFQVEGMDLPALAVFEWGSDGWLGTTAYAVDSSKPAKRDRYVEGLRAGTLAYRRK